MRVLHEEPALFDGVAVDAAGELDAVALRRNIVTGEIARYLAGLDRLLEIEAELAREMLGERKAAHHPGRPAGPEGAPAPEAGKPELSARAGARPRPAASAGSSGSSGKAAASCCRVARAASGRPAAS